MVSENEDPKRNMTDAEKLLWSRIDRKQIGNLQFYNQKIIGNFIADFCCPDAGLIIEVDNEQHSSDEGSKNDYLRDRYFKSLKLKVIRFSDKDVKSNIDAVCDSITEFAKKE